MKTIYRILALVLMVAGLGISEKVGAAGKILEATGFQAIKAPNNTTNTNNTWSPYTSNGTYGTCTTTAHGVTLTSANMTVNTTNFTVKDTKSFTISVASGSIYRVVFKPKTTGVGGSQTALSASTGSWAGSDTWVCADSYWGFTNGKSSVTFTNNCGQDYSINSINVYTYRDATDAEASLSESSFTVSANNEESKSTRLTTNLGISFDGANSPYNNYIDTDGDINISESTIEFESSMYSTTYSNGSTINFDIYPYAEGTYNPAFVLGYQSSSDQANNYYMIALWIPFTVEVTDACTKTPTVEFGTASPAIANYNAISCSTTSFTRTATVKYNNVATGQTITYRSNNEDVAEVSSAGVVTINGIGSARITASVQSDGDYCGADDYYDITVTGYTVTLHYPSCVADAGLTGTSKTFNNVCGAFSLNYDMAVEGYRFAGWTTSAVTTNPSSVSPLYSTSSIDITSNRDLYAVYSAVSNEFQLSTASTIEAGDYVITGSYNATNAPVMTNSLNNGKLTANTEDYTVTGTGKLTCTEEQCIWTLAAVTGGWTIKNSATGKYLSAASGATSNNDLKLRMVDTPDEYSVWTISQGSQNRYNVVNNKRNSDDEARKNLYANSGYFGFYTTISPFFFKRTSSSGTYTSEPSCSMSEYTVTIQNQTEGTAVASGTGGVCVWDSPVLSKLYGTETVTLTATPATGYQFLSWTVVSGGVTLSSTSTNPATFTMPTNNVVIRPNFGPQTYDITYKDKGDDAFSGTHATGYPTEHTYGTPTDLLTATKTGYVFMGWYDNSACTGSPVTQLGATAYTADITLYALFLQLTDPLAWCPEPTVTLTGDNVYVTGTYRTNGAVMAVNQLTLNANNLIANGVVRLSTPAGSGVYFSTARDVNFTKASKPTATVDITADAGGDITDQTIYVHYLPSAAGDGTPQSVAVRAEYQSNTSYYSTKDVHVRNMPEQFAVATKVGTSWYALPADIGSASNPAGVLLDVDETTWTARGAATLAYTLWPVVTTNTANDQYQTYGEMIRLAGNSNKALWTSDAASTYTINNSAAISTLGSGADAANYRWAVATTEAGTTWKYTLTTAQTNNTNDLRYWQSKWGTYNSGGTSINEVYFLPLTVVEDAQMSVMEWGESEVALKCAENTTLTSVKINGTAVTPTPTLAELTGDIMKLSGLPNLSTLDSYAMKNMVVSVSEGGTAKQFVTIIPFILTSTNSPAATPKTTIDLRNLAEGSSQDARNDKTAVVDVVIRNGAQLDVTTASGNATACKFNDMYIYPGGKLNISENSINLSNVYLRGGFSWLDASKDFRLPQMKVTDGMNITGIGTTGHRICYDFTADRTMFYMLALPADVDVNDITNEEGTKKFGATIKSYSGKGRTENPQYSTTPQWTAIESGSLRRGVGYEVTVKARNSRWYGILRFPLKTNAWSNEIVCEPSVTNWGYESVNTIGANNVGWNLVGNPFYSAFESDATGDSKIATEGFKPHLVNGYWDGTYEWATETVKYYTVPNKMDYGYEDVRATDYKLEAFYPFYVQVKTAGTLTFASANRVLRAPSTGLHSMAQAREMTVDFLIEDEQNHKDVAGLNISDEYSAQFDFDDKEKTIEPSVEQLKLYTLTDGYRVAFNSLPEISVGSIPMGYIAPAAGEYEISLKEGSDVQYFDEIVLVDHEMNDTEWNLLQGGYRFGTEEQKSGNDTRFVLKLKLKEEQQDIDTEWSGAGLDKLSVYSGNGELILHNVPQDAQLWLYDMTGKLVENRVANMGGMLRFMVPTGVYNIRVQSGTEGKTIRAIVK